MDIHRVLQQLPPKKRIYLKWKFNLWFDQEKKLTEQEILQQLGVKTLNGYIRWEKSEDYKHFVSVYLASKSAQDMLNIYETVKDKASKGDMKAIDMMLKLQREINAHKKAAEEYFAGAEDDDDGLEL
jgi:hypothetical protein